jgi:hypothetical protein
MQWCSAASLVAAAAAHDVHRRWRKFMTDAVAEERLIEAPEPGRQFFEQVLGVEQRGEQQTQLDSHPLSAAINAAEERGQSRGFSIFLPQPVEVSAVRIERDLLSD